MARQLWQTLGSWIIPWIALCLWSSALLAEDTSWLFNVNCPSSGQNSASFDFEANTVQGFEASGSCTRNPQGFTKFTFEEYNANLLVSTTRHGHHSGDVLIVPPLMDFETKPIFLSKSICPSSNKTLNWIFSKWDQDFRNGLASLPVFGTATYDTSTGLELTSAYSLTSTNIFTGSLALSGSCTDGIYALSGTGDRGGSVVFTQNGSGYFSALSKKSTLFVPAYTISAAADLGSTTLKGIQFNSADAESSRPVLVTTNAGGTTWTLNAYDDPDTGTLDNSFTDTITFGGVNTPINGVMTGTVSRSGTGAGTGIIRCLVSRGISTRVNCVARTPSVSNLPYSLSLTIEGPKVLGQQDEYTVAGAATTIGNPQATLVVGTKLLLADSANHRILIWNSIPTANGTPPDVVLGQPNFVSTANRYGGTSDRSFFYPTGMHSDGTRLFVADTSNHRILVWNTIPTSNHQPANLVLGQTSFTGKNANTGGISASTLYGPSAVWWSGSRLVVADSGNHRVLIWSSLPTSNGQAANYVIGQPDMSTGTANTGGLSAQSLNTPTSIWGHSGRFWVVDSENNRVLAYNSVPNTNHAAAVFALGQSNLTSNAANAGGLSAATLSSPMAIWSNSVHVYVADYGNNRVLDWSTAPTASGASANLVLGQPDFVSNSSNNGGYTAATSLRGPAWVNYGASKLFVADSGNSRVLAWNSGIAANQEAADLVVGQQDFDLSLENTHPTVSATSLSAPGAHFVDGTRLVVTDSHNNRILIWDPYPKSNNESPTRVLGQADFTTRTFNFGGISASSIGTPRGAFVTGTKLIVADTANHRVLIWNTLPTSNNQAADVVLGQPNFTSRTCNNGGVSSSTLCSPMGIYSDGTKLFVAEQGSNRVLIWNTLPTVNQTAADVVVGQANFTTSTENTGGVGAGTLKDPSNVLVTSGKLVVFDKGNHRVLIWNSVPSTNGVSANVVFGQPNFTSNQENQGTYSGSLSKLRFPTGGSVYNGKLLLADYGNNRILVFDSLPTSNGAEASYVLGQPSTGRRTPNTLGFGGMHLWMPYHVANDGVRMFITDAGNNRMLGFDLP